jgi:hypothetical protein
MRAPDCDIDPALESIVMRMLEKAPGDRFASADEVLQALHGYERARTNPRARVVTGIHTRISRAHSTIEPQNAITTDQITPAPFAAPRTRIRRRMRPQYVRPAVLAAAVAALALAALLVVWRIRTPRTATDSIAAINVPADESQTAAAVRDRRIHQESPPPAPEVLEQPDQHGIVEVPLPAQPHSAIPSSNVDAPTAQEVAKLYGGVGRELSTLETTRGLDATIDLWPRYRWIRINEAMISPEKRMQTLVMLQRLQRDIRDQQRSK